MLQWVALLLFIRSLVLALFEPKKWPGRASDILLSLLLALFTGGLFLISSTSYDPAAVMVFAAVIGVSLALRLYGLFRNNPLVNTIKCLSFGVFWGLSILAIALNGFTHLCEDKPIAKVVITGKRLKKWVEWKNSDGPFRQKWVDTSEVILETTDGSTIGKYYIYGDLVAVRARIIRFRPILNFLGIPNVCHIEAIYNGYNTMERHNQLPHLGYPLPLPISFFRHLWEKGFYLNWRSPWIKSTTLESNYFPLHDSRDVSICTSFWLTVTDGGLSSYP